MEAVGRTAQLTAAVRAEEAERPDRLVDDPYARALAGPEGLALLAQVAAGLPPGAVATGIVIRTRWVDDQLRAAMRGGDARQVVLLAAGLDTRAYRLGLRGVSLFELDHPAVLDRKAELLGRLGVVPSVDRRAVPVDLARPWAERLLDAGLDPAQPTAWVAEGLLVYLDQAQVETLLGELTTLSAPGSRLLTDTVGRSLLDSPAFAGYLERLAAHGSPWRYGTDDPAGLLERFGWQATALRYGEDGANYGRWPLPVPPPDDVTAPRSHLVTAVR